MRMLFKNGMVYSSGHFSPMDILVDNGRIAARGDNLTAEGSVRVYDLTGLAVFPGFADVHVHLREPGFSYKETIATGTKAAARGGYTTVCAMPNLSPAPDSIEHLKVQQDLIDRDSVIRVVSFASITVGQKGEGELVDMASLAPHVAGFSDDGRGVREESTMREAMLRCKAAGSIISAHCEDTTLIPMGAPIHDGAYAHAHGIPGIPSESEWKPIARDIALCRETGCRYHVCHVSCKESVSLIRQAKAEGLDITCETAPHYLLLCQDDLRDDGCLKMNPPLRDASDRDALLEGLRDGTIDCIATDHAPHSAKEKSKGLTGSAMGIPGIETAFPLLYTYLAETGKIPLETIIHALTEAPRSRFRLGGGLEVGDEAAFTVFDLHTDRVIDPDRFLSMGHATPFAGMHVHAACRMTVAGDRIAYQSTD